MRYRDYLKKTQDDQKKRSEWLAVLQKSKNEVEMKLIKETEAEYYTGEIAGNTSKPRDTWRQ